MSHVIGLACALDVQPSWSAQLQQAGLASLWTPLDPTPETQCHPVCAWVVVLGADQTPHEYLGWLQSLGAPLILVTAYPSIARSLSDALPQLMVIAHPTRAALALADLVRLALGSHGPTLVLGPVAKMTYTPRPAQRRPAWLSWPQE